ncbi:MAG: tRNA pseudouridine(55) synthase TruB [Bradymonadia bacterium]
MRIQKKTVSNKASGQDWRGGVLLVDKPSGPTSFDVIRQVRKAMHMKKVGHTGTLDPMASGLMVLCLGEATRVVQYLTATDKTYEATVELGVESDTYDAEGEINRLVTAEQASAISTDVVREALSTFSGWIEQVPPAFSAIKVDGERLYAKARRGEEVTVPSRQVRIDRCDLLRRSGPDLSLRISCSKGTYIRSISHDLGRRLGCGGLLTSLRRTHVGQLDVSQAVSLDEIQSLEKTEIVERCLSVGEALAEYPKVTMSWDNAKKLRFGQTLISSELPERDFLAYDPNFVLIALMQGRDEMGKTKILRGFPTV